MGSPQRYFSIAAISALVLCGCISRPHVLEATDLLIGANATLNPPAELSVAQVRRDALLLGYALEHGYGGARLHARPELADVLQKIRSIGERSTPEAFRDRIDELLFTLPDHHLVARLNDETSELRQRTKRVARIGSNSAVKPGAPWEVRTERVHGKKVLIVCVTRFPSAKDPVWTGFIPAVVRDLKSAHALVLDFRGNDGGDDTYGIKLAEALYGFEPPSPVARKVKLMTPTSLVLEANRYRLRELRMRAAGKPVPAYNAELFKNKMEEVRKASAGEIEREKMEIYPAPKQPLPRVSFGNPIFILMDADCSSSCESTIEAFEAHPFVRRVGENTSGMLHTGDVGHVLLPQSRIRVQIPTHAIEYRDRRFVERIGISPDIRVPAGQDGLQFLRDRVIR